MNQINTYNKKETWNRDLILERMKIVVSSNMDKIEECVDSRNDREALSELAEVIKTEFPEDKEVEEIAIFISHHVNKNFFSYSDPLKLILSYLPPGRNEFKRQREPKSRLEHVKLVSKSFYEMADVVKKEWVQKEMIPLKIYGYDTITEIIEHLKKNNLLNVNLEGFEDFSNDDLLMLFENCPKIQRIHMEGYTSVDANGLVQLFAKKHPDLLYFTWEYMLNDEVLMAMAKNCPNLEQIEIVEESCHVTDEGVKALVKHCPNLNYINLDCHDISKEGLKAIAENCHLLKRLVVSSLDLECEGLRSIFENCSNLEVINLENGSVDDEDNGGIWIGWKFGPKLREIHLESDTRIDEMFCYILENCPSLEEFYLDSYLSGEKFKFTKKYLNVHTIKINSTYTTYETIKAIIEHCPNLKTFDISRRDPYNSYLQNEDYMEFDETYPHLEILY